MKNRGLIQNLKGWLDGNEEELLNNIILETPPRKADAFMTKIAQRLDGVLQDEMFIPINKKAQVPARFIVFLNKIDDALWQNSKRSALEETLSDLVFERAAELALPNELSVSNIEVILKPDNSLAHPMFQVTAVWQDDEQITSLVEQPTVIENGNLNYSNKSPLFKVRVQNNFAFREELHFFKDEIFLGRGSASQKVDIVLGEPNISRLHAKLIYLEKGNFTLTNLGKNTIFAGNEMIYPETSCKINQLQNIKIGNFTLALLQETEAPPMPNYPETPNFEYLDRYRTTKD